eukprot:7852534-Alexandrium_andersonii.AAC.1
MVVQSPGLQRWSLFDPSWPPVARVDEAAWEHEDITDAPDMTPAVHHELAQSLRECAPALGG